jgi:HEAT repeat protein
VRSAAARGLGRISPEPQSVVPSLIRVAGDEDEWVCGAAVAALGLIQKNAGVDLPEVRRVLVDAVNDENLHVREMGIYAFGATAEKSPALPIAVLKDPDVRARRTAVIAMARSSSLAADAIPELTEALTDGDRWVRLGAARALENLGIRSPSVISVLTEAPE